MTVMSVKHINGIDTHMDKASDFVQQSFDNAITWAGWSPVGNHQICIHTCYGIVKSWYECDIIFITQNWGWGW